MSELNLLIECINTEGEAENGGVKYIYMDSDTIYRFENNRMKKISKSLINKARKQLSAQNAIHQVNGSTKDDYMSNEKQSRTVNSRTKVKKTKRNVITDDDDENENELAGSYPVALSSADNYNSTSVDESNDDELADNESIELRTNAKKSKSTKLKSVNSKLAPAPAPSIPLPTYSPNINLDEYYNNKNKMEYMNLEIARLNSKVDKLKHYKAIVNKLTGNEFDLDTSTNLNSQYLSTQPQSQPQSQSQLQSTQSIRNDSLFLY